MNKIFYLFLVFVLATTDCKNQMVACSTLLGDGTPYYQYPEKLLGKVLKVKEKNYWTIHNGDTYKKGKSLSRADSYSVGAWTVNFEASFDNSGDLLNCKFLDENDKFIFKYEISQENYSLITGKKIQNDTLIFYDKYKLDKDGKKVGFIRYTPVVDTMFLIYDVKINNEGDTLTYNLVNSKGKPQYSNIYVFNNLGQFSCSGEYDKNGIFQQDKEVEYNDMGKVSKLILFDKNKKVTHINYFTYEYDQKGNWIKALVNDGLNKRTVVLKERVYTYFE